MKQNKDFGSVVAKEIATDPGLSAGVEIEAFNYNIAEQLYKARREAGLTQEQLAKLAKTRQSVIARMEDADYEGHSITMLRRIAEALNKRVYLEFRTKFTDAPKHNRKSASKSRRPTYPKQSFQVTAKSSLKPGRESAPKKSAATRK